MSLIDLIRDRLGNNTNRADLRFGVDAAGEVYVLTKADGMVRKLVTCDPCDADCDGRRDGRDVGAFVDALLGNGDSWSACAGDISHDDHVWTEDIAAFVECVLAG